MNRMTRIRDLNDAFRRSFSGGWVVMTRGIASLPTAEQVAILDAVRGFAAFHGGPTMTPMVSTISVPSSTPGLAFFGR
jgi:hypothetical protein